jgi:hypothetical protein
MSSNKRVMTNVYVKGNEIEPFSQDDIEKTESKDVSIDMAIKQDSEKEIPIVEDDVEDNEEESTFELLDDAGEQVIMKCGEDLGEFQQIVEVIDDTKFVEYTDEQLRMQIIDLLNYDSDKHSNKRDFANTQKYKKFLNMMKKLNSKASLLETQNGFIIPRICNKPIRIMTEDEEELNELADNMNDDNNGEDTLLDSSKTYVNLWDVLVKRKNTLKSGLRDKDTNDELMIQERLWEKSKVISEDIHRIQMVIKKDTFALDYSNKLILLFVGEVVEVSGFAHIPKRESFVSKSWNHFKTVEYINHLKQLNLNKPVHVYKEDCKEHQNKYHHVTETDHSTYLRLEDGLTISLQNMSQNNAFVFSLFYPPYPETKHPHHYITEGKSPFIFDLLPQDQTGYETLKCFVPSTNKMVLCALQNAIIWHPFVALSLRSIEKYIENVYEKNDDEITSDVWTTLKDQIDSNVKNVCSSIKNKIMRTKKYKSAPQGLTSVMKFDEYDYVSNYRDGGFKYENTLIDTEYFRSKFISKKDSGLQYFGIVLSREVEKLYQWIEKHKDSLENEKTVIARQLKTEFNYNVDCLDKAMNIVKTFKSIQEMEKTNNKKMSGVQINDYAKVIVGDGREMLYKREAISDDQHVWTFQAVEDLMMLTDDSCKCVLEDVETVCSYRDILRHKNLRDLKKSEYTLLKNMLSFHQKFTEMQKLLIQDRNIWEEYFNWSVEYFNDSMSYVAKKDYSAFVGNEEDLLVRTFDEEEQGDSVNYSILPTFVSETSQESNPLNKYREEDIAYVKSIIEMFGLGYDDKEIAYILLQLDMAKKRNDLPLLYAMRYKQAGVSEPRKMKQDPKLGNETSDKKKKAQETSDKLEKEKMRKRAQIRDDVDKSWHTQIISEIIVYMISIFQARYPVVRITGLIQEHKSHFDVTGPPLQMIDQHNKHENRSLLSYMCYIVADMKNKNIKKFLGFEDSQRAVYKSLLQEIKKTLIKVPQLEIALRNRKNIVERHLYGYNEWKGYRPFVLDSTSRQGRLSKVSGKVLEFMKKPVDLVTLKDIKNDKWGKITDEKNKWTSSIPSCICDDKNEKGEKETIELKIPTQNIHKMKQRKIGKKENDDNMYPQDPSDTEYWNVLIETTRESMYGLLEKYRCSETIIEDCMKNLFEISVDKRLCNKYAYSYWLTNDFKTLKGRLLNNWKFNYVWLTQNKQFARRKHEFVKLSSMIQQTVDQLQPINDVLNRSGEFVRNWMTIDFNMKALQTNGFGEISQDKMALFQIAIYNEALLEWFKMLDIDERNDNIPHKEIYEMILQSLFDRISIHSKDNTILSRLNEELREKQKETIMNKMGRLSPEERWAINEARGLRLFDWSVLDSVEDEGNASVNDVIENEEGVKDRNIEDGEDNFTGNAEDGSGSKMDNPDDDVISDTENDYDRYGQDE